MRGNNRRPGVGQHCGAHKGKPVSITDNTQTRFVQN